MKIIRRTLRAILRYYRLRRRNPQCPYKLAQWVEGHREIGSCSLSDCQSEAKSKLSGKCACGRFQAQP